MKLYHLFSLSVLTVLFTGCSLLPSQNTRDLSVYANNLPKSILVLPPINETPDTRATNSFWSTVTIPVAEAGYYVFPITLVDTMFKENGVFNGAEAQGIDPKKLQEIFGADAALYIKVKEYGSKYQLVQTTATVEVEAKLVDLKSGVLLWEGREKQVQAGENHGGGLVGMLVSAVVQQISNHLSDKAYVLSSGVSHILFSPSLNQQKGLLYGPRSPHFVENGVSPQR
jgi:hypothetical protein